MADTKDLSIDFETFSEIDLPDQGAHKYAQHESTDALCAAWAFGDEEPNLWLPGEPCPPAIVDHILVGGTITAWNAAFERLIFKYVMGPKFGWPIPTDDQYDCTMVRAMAMNMPASLDMAAPAFGLDIKKDDVGRRVMLQLSRPRKPTKKNPDTRWTPQNAPDKFEILYGYVKQDVRVERGVRNRTVPLRQQERQRYLRDLIVNDRGVYIDMPLVRAARKIADEEKARLDREINEITDGKVRTTNSVVALKAFVESSGIAVKSLDKDGLARLLVREDLNDPLYDRSHVKRALEIRQEAAKTSTSKLEAFEGRLCKDGTVKGTLQILGATQTGRDAARGLQVQNFPRPDPEARRDIVAAIADLMSGDADFVRAMQGAPLSCVADCLRGMIRSRKNRKLWSRDLSQIEARMTAWMAGQDDLLDAFRAFDNKEGPDIYTIAAAKVYNIDPSAIDKKSDKRQVGKVSTLALGFGGGANAFGAMAKIYKVDVSDAFDTVWGMSSVEYRDRATEAWAERGKASGMKKKAWIAAELIKLAWREANSEIVSWWYELGEAAVDAVNNPGTTFTARKMRYRMSGSWLKGILPSGRPIYYPYAKVESIMTPWGKQRPAVKFWAVDGYTRKWSRHTLTHLLLAENAVQAASRDVMMEAWDRAEDAGYECIMRVHDELIADTEEDFGSDEEFDTLFTQSPTWAPDLPVAADGWEGDRYRKG